MVAALASVHEHTVRRAIRDGHLEAFRRLGSTVYYARLFDEAPEHPVPAEEAIRAARRHIAQERLAV